MSTNSWASVVIVRMLNDLPASREIFKAAFIPCLHPGGHRCRAFFLNFGIWNLAAYTLPILLQRFTGPCGAHAFLDLSGV